MIRPDGQHSQHSAADALRIGPVFFCQRRVAHRFGHFGRAQQRRHRRIAGVHFVHIAVGVIIPDFPRVGFGIHVFRDLADLAEFRRPSGEFALAVHNVAAGIVEQPADKVGGVFGRLPAAFAVDAVARFGEPLSGRFTELLPGEPAADDRRGVSFHLFVSRNFVDLVRDRGGAVHHERPVRGRVFRIFGDVDRPVVRSVLRIAVGPVEIEPFVAVVHVAGKPLRVVDAAQRLPHVVIRGTGVGLAVDADRLPGSDSLVAAVKRRSDTCFIKASGRRVEFFVDVGQVSHPDVRQHVPFDRIGKEADARSLESLREVDSFDLFRQVVETGIKDVRQGFEFRSEVGNVVGRESGLQIAFHNGTFTECGQPFGRFRAPGQLQRDSRNQDLPPFFGVVVNDDRFDRQFARRNRQVIGAVTVAGFHVFAGFAHLQRIAQHLHVFGARGERFADHPSCVVRRIFPLVEKPDCTADDHRDTVGGAVGVADFDFADGSADLHLVFAGFSQFEMLAPVGQPAVPAVVDHAEQIQRASRRSHRDGFVGAVADPDGIFPFGNGGGQERDRPTEYQRVARFDF